MHDRINDYSLAGEFLSLFAGLDTVHGVFFPERFEGKKHVGKALTKREPITKELWASHLQGKVGLGVVPINAESECVWGAIDVDNYDLDFVELLQSVKDMPLVVCRSKSGGAHIFVFSSKPVSARKIRDYLRNVVGLVGLGSSEIFPKQDQILTERGDVGNWLNMPYFGTYRKGIVLSEGQVRELSAREFLTLANEKRISKDFFLKDTMKSTMMKALSKVVHRVCK